MVCPTCEGDGIERCTNPDHGFIQALSFTDMGRIGCPCCGHDEKHRIIGCKCPDCNGTGVVKGAKNTEQQVQLDAQSKPESLFNTLAEATRPAARELT
jgi:ssDNA-binding Zn-finger/Zn-ribbon topoisomerase 1